MAASSLVSMATLSSPLSHQRAPSSNAFLKPLTLRLPKSILSSSSSSKSHLSVGVRASVINEKAVTAGLTAVALTAAMVIPEIAEAAQPGVSPSLKNFLLSIVSGGVVLGALVGAVIGVSNFDPVKRT